MPAGADSDWPERLRVLWSGELHRDSPMASRCTLRVGGPARALAIPGNQAELQSLLVLLTELGVRRLVIGQGSNLLFADEGYDGVVIMLGRKFADIERLNGAKVRAEAGCGLTRLVNWCASQGLAGLEFAAGIPGSVGGAVAMNAGAWGREIKDVLASVTFLRETGERVKMASEELLFSYRHLECKGLIVASAEFILKPGDRRVIAEKCARFVRERKAKQPQGVASAGSFFKNPPEGPPAGRLIQDAGLKGLRVGGAQVSELHGNFLINTGSASVQDFLTLMRQIQARVAENSGIRLEPEVRIVES